jgi:hypothetical protein
MVVDLMLDMQHSSCWLPYWVSGSNPIGFRQSKEFDSKFEVQRSDFDIEIFCSTCNTPFKLFRFGLVLSLLEPHGPISRQYSFKLLL